MTCQSRSPQSDLPCRLADGHPDCHEAIENDVVTVCWGHTDEELDEPHWKYGDEPDPWSGG